jgi:hypothetical protein
MEENRFSSFLKNGSPDAENPQRKFQLLLCNNFIGCETLPLILAEEF